MASIRGPSRRLTLHHRWRLLGVGLILLALGSPATLGLAVRYISVFGLPLIGATTALFVLGWGFVGAGLHPRGHVRRGAATALILYVLVGVIWAATYTVINPYNEHPTLGVFLGSRLLMILFWPWHLAFVLELFGLGPQ